MAEWILIACLKALFAEFNRIAPSRDHASDGAIGDTAHQREVSDHNPDETGAVPIHDADKTNEVHAIDVDNNLNESDLTMEKVVQFLLARCRSGDEKRLRYIIWNRRIWSASSGWVQKTYTGASQHTEHAHFSASYDSKLEASTASWHLEDIPVALTTSDKKDIENLIKANAASNAEVQAAAIAAIKDQLDDIAKAVTEYKLPGTSVAGSTYTRGLNDMVPDGWQLIFTGKTKGGDPIPKEGVYGQILSKLSVIEAALATPEKPQ
jgi:hypothetical protein